ncbi:MAG: putative TetR family transcriptional regulator [Acidimicrobiales bacterium]|jgi:TetR/AcrR family tetracycline transcriptional repressor|nr:putative TetR family transcriptional regulator [Acidimicrobiales bacterium]
MSRQSTQRTDPLTVDAIVDAACALINDTGLAALSMRRLGAALGVDPMAVYHHVPNKRDLLSLVTARVIRTMPMPAADAPWKERVQGWAMAYRDVAVANRDLVAARLADPVVAAGGVPLVAPLAGALVDSGIALDLVEPNVWLIVDFVHGAALGAGEPRDRTDEDIDPHRWAFAVGLDTIVAGIAACAAANGHKDSPSSVQPLTRAIQRPSRR